MAAVGCRGPLHTSCPASWAAPVQPQRSTAAVTLPAPPLLLGGCGVAAVCEAPTPCLSAEACLLRQPGDQSQERAGVGGREAPQCAVQGAFPPPLGKRQRVRMCWGRRRHHHAPGHALSLPTFAYPLRPFQVPLRVRVPLVDNPKVDYNGS